MTTLVVGAARTQIVRHCAAFSRTRRWIAARTTLRTISLFATVFNRCIQVSFVVYISNIYSWDIQCWWRRRWRTGAVQS